MQMSDKTAQILHISNLVPYSNHPFKLYEGERLDDMVRSIRELGVLQPIIVRSMDKPESVYEILSGHNRVNAAKLVGLTEVPVIIKTGLTDEEAKLIVTETNLIQRSFADLSHSERAIALKTHMNAITKQGKRNDLINEITNILVAFESGDEETCGLIDHKTKSRDKTAVKYGIDPRSVSRYVRLSQLIPELLNRVDNGEIGLYPAVSISYLSLDEQARLNGILEDNASFKVDMKKAEALRKLSRDKMLVDRNIYQILSSEIGKSHKSPPALKIKHKIYSKFFNADSKPKEMEAVIEQALTEYFAQHKKSEGEESA
jgi:ParB family chromosome partitioning protein